MLRSVPIDANLSLRIRNLKQIQVWLQEHSKKHFALTETIFAGFSFSHAVACLQNPTSTSNGGAL